MTQGANQGFHSRQSSPNKQSVLVKRVMQDGRVVSGLDNPSPDLANEEQDHDEDAGTLASNGEPANKDNMARESNVVNYATNESNESRLRSTIYISGKSQKFALGGKHAQSNARVEGARASPSSIRSPIKKTMIINLGERTQTSNFPSGQVLNGTEQIGGELVVGVTDITTGATHILQSPQQNKDAFSPKLKHKQMINRSSSHGSGVAGPVDLEDASQIQHTQAFQKFNETGV